VPCCLVGSPSPVNYDDAGEQPVHVVTPLIAVLTVVNTFVTALLAVAFITDHTGICTGIAYHLDRFYNL